MSNSVQHSQETLRACVEITITFYKRLDFYTQTRPKQTTSANKLNKQGEQKAVSSKEKTARIA